MDEPLGRKRSKIQEESGTPYGCMGGLLHFLDFNQRFHVRKMLAYNKRSSAGRHSQRTKSPKAKQDVSTSEASPFMDKDENVQVQDKGRVSRNNSDKVLMRSLNSKRRHSQPNQTTPLTAHLLRTFSIHHLDSNDYVEDMAHDNGNPTVVPNSHERLQSEPLGGQTKLNKIPGHLLEKHSLLRDKLMNAKDASSKKKDMDANELEHDATFHQSKELMEMMVLLNNNRGLLLQILNDPSAFTNFMETQNTASAERVLDKSGSFPRTSLSCCQNGKMSNGSQSLVYERDNLQVGTSSTKLNSNENLFESPNKLSSSFRMKDQRECQWDNQTALSRFKIIKKRIKDVVKENRKEGLRISMDGVLHKVPYGSKLSKDTKKEKQGILDIDNSKSKSMKRSHSLTESLDKYSRLLESISSSEFKRAPAQSKSKQEDRSGLHVGKPQKTLGRIFSLPDFDSNSLRKTVQHEVHDTAQSLKIALTVDDTNEPKIIDAIVDSEEKLQGDASVIKVIEEVASETILGDKERLRSPISDLDTYSPETLELKSSPIQSAELDSSTYHRTRLDIDSYDQSEDGASDFGRLQIPSELDCYYNFFNVQVDTQNEAEFNCVREILWKSGFGTDEFLRAWYSPNQPIDPLLFEELECTSNAEMFLEYQLLFDLINEVLLEIYDNSSSCCPWLSRFDTRTRPMPSGHHILEEVWANISWHLNSQPQLDPTLDHAVARDFTKNDGWMEIQYDCEDIGLELEDLILDDLLYEVVLELDDAHLLMSSFLLSV